MNVQLLTELVAYMQFLAGVSVSSLPVSECDIFGLWTWKSVHLCKCKTTQVQVYAQYNAPFYRVSRPSLPILFLYAKRLLLKSNQRNLVQYISDMFSLSFAYFHWPTLLTNPAWHQKLQVIKFQLWKILKFTTCKWQNSVKFTQKLSKMSWNESRRLARPPARQSIT